MLTVCGNYNSNHQILHKMVPFKIQQTRSSKYWIEADASILDIYLKVVKVLNNGCFYKKMTYLWHLNYIIQQMIG